MIVLTVVLVLAMVTAVGCLSWRRPKDREELTVTLPPGHAASPGDRVRLAAVAEDGERVEADFIVRRVNGAWATVRLAR